MAATEQNIQFQRPSLLVTAGARLMWVLATLFYRARYFGQKNLPETGGCIVASNHQSHLDPPLIGSAAYPRVLVYLARVGLFKNRFFGKLIRGCNAVPLHQDRGDLAAIKTSISVIEQGGAVLIFPEGSRTLDGNLQPFKRGVALLLKRTTCPVVPVAVEGCFDAWPRKRAFPRLFGPRVAVEFGKPIEHEDLMSDGPDAAMHRLAEEIEALRQRLRCRLRTGTGGRYPVGGHDMEPTGDA